MGHPRLCIGKLANESATEVSCADDGSISKVPYAESTFWRDGWTSPYYNESHREFRSTLRKWLIENIREECIELSKSGAYPSIELNQKLGRAGLYAARLGPGAHIKGKNVLGVP